PPAPSPLSLHDALPISPLLGPYHRPRSERRRSPPARARQPLGRRPRHDRGRPPARRRRPGGARARRGHGAGPPPRRARRRSGGRAAAGGLRRARRIAAPAPPRHDVSVPSAIDIIKRRLKEDRVPDATDEIGEKKKRP